MHAIALDVGTLGTGTLMDVCDFGANTLDTETLVGPCGFGVATTLTIVVDLRCAGVETVGCDVVVGLTFGDGNKDFTFESNACDIVGNVIIPLVNRISSMCSLSRFMNSPSSSNVIVK